MELTIEKIQECEKVKKLLDDVCEKYFNTHNPEWESYGGWQFLGPNSIIIHYGYYDWKDQYESGHEVIPIGVLIEFSKNLDKL